MPFTLLLLAAAAWTSNMSHLVDQFVRVQQDDDGNSFLSFNKSTAWACMGANCYYLLAHGADDSRRPGICCLLDSLQKSGFDAVRTWAFNDGHDQWHALQTAPGVYNTKVIEALDWLVWQCKLRGLRLLLVLTNYWEHYGGIQQYVRWSKEHAGLGTTGKVEPEEFYTDARAQAMLMAHISYLLRRTNIFTGVQYTEEPTIMAWELINEPRCREGVGVSPSAMHSWLRTATQQLKQLAPKQLVTIGSEGFWGGTTPEMLQYNPSVDLSHGCDFALEATIPAVDFTSIHMYPDHWLPAGTARDDILSWTHDWLRSHAQYSRQLGKPLVLTEFGSRAFVCAPPEHLANTSDAATCSAVQPGTAAPAGLAAPASTGSQPSTAVQVASPVMAHVVPQPSTAAQAAPAASPRTGMSQWCSAAVKALQHVLTACVVKPAGSFECKDSADSQTQPVLEPYLRRHQYIQYVLDVSFGSQQQAEESMGRAMASPFAAERCAHNLEPSRADRVTGPNGLCRLAGAFLWMVAEPDYPDYDGFTVYEPEAVHVSQQKQQHVCHEQQQQ